MKEKIYLVVTSIAGPNEHLRGLAQGCREHGWKFLLIGDEASPRDFNLKECDFYNLERQRQLNIEFAKRCPTRHYARKNIGYLMAIAGGASVIVETDDDNIPLDSFWQARRLKQDAAMCRSAGWVNVYRYFSGVNIWPRGFPLDEIGRAVPEYESLDGGTIDCAIQQNLADDNPDVDAVYRLVMPLPIRFEGDRRIALAKESYCPFNSQNTTWFSQAYRLMYLPAYCSFRMTDIWRSFVAERIGQENGWPVLFAGPTMRQERNEHNLMRDFEDEVPGYLNNKRIVDELAALSLEAGEASTADNLRICYEKLVSISVVGKEELSLLDAWLGDIQDCEGC
jgi:hypothetical protein